MKKIKFRDICEDIDFHDSRLIEVALSDRLEKIEFIIYAPYDNGNSESGNFFSIIMNRVVKFNFSTLWDGEKQIDPIDIYEIKLVEDEETEKWRNRVKLIIKEYRTEFKENIEAIELHKIVFFSSSHQSPDKNEDEGITVICRDVKINNLGTSWSSEKYKPLSIMSA